MLFRSRLEVGAGFGFGVGKPAPGANTAVRIYVPIQAGVEHFFTRWFSMGIAARTQLIDYQKDDHFSSAINTTTNSSILNTSAVGQLFFYTD